MGKIKPIIRLHKTKIKNAKIQHFYQVNVQTKCWQACELSNFPGVRLISSKDFKMSDMNFLRLLHCFQYKYFFAVKMSSGREFSENHVPVEIYFDINIPAAYFNVWKQTISKNLQCHKMISWILLRKIWQSKSLLLFSQDLAANFAKNGTCIGVFWFLH